MAVAVPKDATPKERALILQGGATATLGYKMYEKRTAKPTPTPPTPPVPKPITQKRAEAQITRPPLPKGPSTVPSIEQARKYKADIDYARKQLEKVEVDSFTIDNKTYTKKELYQQLKDYKIGMDKYIQRRKDIDKSLETLKNLPAGNAFVEAYVDEYGHVHYTPPPDMSQEEQTYLQIKYAPDWATFKSASGETVSKATAESWAYKDFMGYVHAEKQKILARENPLGWLLGSIGMFFKTGGQFIDAVWAGMHRPLPIDVDYYGKEKYQKEIAAIEKKWDRLFRAQGTVLAEFERLEKSEASWGEWAAFFKEEIQFAATFVAAYGIGGLMAKVEHGAVRTFGTHVGKFKTTTVIRTALFVGMGTVMAVDIATKVKTIQDIDKRIKNLNDEFNKRIKEAKGEREREKLKRQKFKETETLEMQKSDIYGDLAVMGLEILVAYKYGKKGYKRVWSKQQMIAMGEQAYGKGTPEFKTWWKQAKATVQMAKVPSKFEYEFPKARKVSAPARKRLVGFLKKEKIVLGGSAAAKAQMKGVRAPKDYDIYTVTPEGAKRLKAKLPNSGIDIHGPKFYKPGEYYEGGFWQQKPIKVKGMRMVRPGDLLQRKFVRATRFKGGLEVAGRIKDIADYEKHMLSQMASAQMSYNPYTRIKGYRAQYLTGVKPPPSYFKPTEVPLTKVPTPTKAKITLPEPITKTPQPIKPTYTTAYPTYPKVYSPYIPPTPYKYPTTPPYPKPPTPRFPTPIYTPPSYKALPPVTTPPAPPYKPPTPVPTIPSVTRAPSPPYLPPKKKKPKKKKTPRILSGAPIRRKAYQPGYHAYVKKDATKKAKARYVKVTPNPMTKNQALGIGALVTDTTVSRTFKVKKAHKPAVPTRLYDFTWSQKRHKFRKPIQKGSKKIVSPRWIEKTTHAIDSPGEFQGITVEGWLAQQRKGKMKKPKISKKTKRKFKPKMYTPKVMKL